uniref:Uncharacterized protein n=1 Tax=Anopheles dirus TaxID=7168 RepID=A0A182MZF2_9DIPT
RYSLTQLLLNYNQLKILNLEILQPLGWFQFLEITHNSLELIVGRFASNKLVQIHFMNNRLKALDFCQWKPMLSLSVLSVQSNYLTEVPQCMHNLPNLTYISFMDNKFTAISLDSFAAHDTPFKLDMSENKITRITVDDDRFPEALQELLLKDNTVECANPPDLPFCPLDIEYRTNSPDGVGKRHKIQRQLNISCHQCDLYGSSMFHRGFGMILLGIVFNLAEGFDRNCDRIYYSTCIIAHLNPKETNLSFNLNLHRVKGISSITLKHLESSTVVDHSLLDYFGMPLYNLAISESMVERVIVPSNFTVKSLFIEKTLLSSIHFQKNEYIRELEIVSSNLRNVPRTLGNLKNLTRINIQHSYIQHLNLDFLQAYEQLNTLNLEYNKIHTITSSPNGTQRYSLTTLLLNYNQLKILNLEILQPLGWFQLLKISHNPLELIVGRFTSNKLNQIYLMNNRLKALDFCQWQPMPSVTYLSVRSNYLTELPHCMHNLPNLTSVSFRSNKFTSINLDTFSAQGKPFSLDMSRNKISLITVHEDKFPVALVDLLLVENNVECSNPPDIPFCPLDIEYRTSAPDG